MNKIFNENQTTCYDGKIFILKGAIRISDAGSILLDGTLTDTQQKLQTCFDVGRIY